MTAEKNFSSRKKRVLLLYGGWEGHQPEICAEWAAGHLLADFDIVKSQDLCMLKREVLADFDLLVPIWTFGEISEAQEEALLQAVANGLGFVGWHGAASSFLESRPHKFLLGGQFVGHPGGNHVPYSVHFLGNDPLVEGLPDFNVITEQYYLLIDPAVQILATTSIDGAHLDWLSGVQMPVAWKREWGKGRVFYCALGHTLDVLEQPPMTELLRRAINWAVRNTKKR